MKHCSCSALTCLKNSEGLQARVTVKQTVSRFLLLTSFSAHASLIRVHWVSSLLICWLPSRLKKSRKDKEFLALCPLLHSCLPSLLLISLFHSCLSLVVLYWLSSLDSIWTVFSRLRCECISPEQNFGYCRWHKFWSLLLPPFPLRNHWWRKDKLSPLLFFLGWFPFVLAQLKPLNIFAVALLFLQTMCWLLLIARKPKMEFLDHKMLSSPSLVVRVSQAVSKESAFQSILTLWIRTTLLSFSRMILLCFIWALPALINLFNSSAAMTICSNVRRRRSSWVLVAHARPALLRTVCKRETCHWFSLSFSLCISCSLASYSVFCFLTSSFFLDFSFSFSLFLSDC